jgi:hypothetical protein
MIRNEAERDRIEKAPDEAGAIAIRDRIRELRRVKARDLVPHPKNWRKHPRAQAAALRGLLTEIGYADALLVRELPDGALMIIDGHLRAETTPDLIVPVLVLDVTEDEAEKLLITLDPLAAMAESDAERMRSLLRTVQTDSEAIQETAETHCRQSHLGNNLPAQSGRSREFVGSRSTPEEMGDEDRTALANRPAPRRLWG